MARTKGGTQLMTGSLDQKAMLVKLSISQWGNRKMDKIASEKTRQDFGVSSGVINTTKSLVANTALTKINSKIEAARSYHIKHTLPWTDDGFRMLTSASYLSYMEAMRQFKTEIEAAVAEVAAGFDTLKQEAQVMLGKLYNESEYPSDVTAKYRMVTRVMPIPKSNDFRVTHISPEEIERIEKEIAEQLKEAEKSAMDHLWGQVREAMMTIVEKLKDPNPRFHDTVLDGLIDLMDLVPELNISGSVDMDYVRKVVQTQICHNDPKELRQNKEARTQVAADAENILKLMEGYCG